MDPSGGSSGTDKPVVSDSQSAGQPPVTRSTDKPANPQDQVIRNVVESEELIQALSIPMSTLADAISNSNLSSSQFVDETIQHKGLDTFDLPNELASPSQLSRGTWPLQSESNSGGVAKVWQSLFDVLAVSDIKFGILQGKFVGDDFEMKTKAEGHLRTLSDNPRPPLIGFNSKQILTWSLIDDAWKVTEWEQTEFNWIAAPGPMFEDVTSRAITDPDVLKRLTQSQHEDLIIERLQSGSMKAPREKYSAFADWESSYQYPAVSVVDLDRDGWDDLFVTDRWDQAILLRNMGDGTFEDVTEDSGLVVKDLSNCALFADFDNDGDSDVLVGRTLGDSQYFINNAGKFSLDEESSSELKDVKFVVSGSVVDLNRDGLLDVYLNTYGTGSGPLISWFSQTTRMENRVKMQVKGSGRPFYVDRIGPPNVVLINDNGKLKHAKVGDELKQWRNSYQSVWSDFDNDGDADAYICNDFSPDAFLRNDTERGSAETKFTDVSKEIVPDGTMGFGMGASWGDYNNDGKVDLYVSNMYSKAGRRIVGQMGNVDPRIEISSQGNFLYENEGDHFSQVAGLNSDDVHVSKVGWSFGGQFADFDNDSNLDLYVPSGFYTAPKSVATKVDM